MEALAEIILPLAVKYGPELVDDVKQAFVKAGYTIPQIDAVFNMVKAYKDLGINPNAPVKPE